MPFLDHLEELRWRILKALVALAVAFAFSFWLCWNYDVIAFLSSPIQPFLGGRKLIYTHPMALLTILMQLAGALGIVLSSPVVGYQIWAFLSPALTARERRLIVPVLAGAAGLFLCGVALAVFLFIPVTMTLIQGINTTAIEPMISASDYFGFLTMISLAFGAVFELPILILTLTALGLLTPATLAKYRRHVFVVALVACQIIVPGDLVISSLMLFIPVYGLYELSIVLSWLIFRKKRRSEAQSESIGAGATA